MENGLTEEKISELDATGASFSKRELLGVLYAEKLAVDHRSMTMRFSMSCGRCSRIRRLSNSA